MRALLLAILAASASPDAPSHAEKAEWTVDARPAAKVVRGSAGKITLEIAARAGFHINDEYPLRFQPAESPGVSFPKTRFDRADGLEVQACTSDASHHCQGRLPITFTASGAGPVRVGGTLAFGVCDENRCLIEKVVVSTPVEVAQN